MHDLAYFRHKLEMISTSLESNAKVLSNRTVAIENDKKERVTTLTAVLGNLQLRCRSLQEKLSCTSSLVSFRCHKLVIHVSKLTMCPGTFDPRNEEHSDLNGDHLTCSERHYGDIGHAEEPNQGFPGVEDHRYFNSVVPSSVFCGSM